MVRIEVIDEFKRQLKALVKKHKSMKQDYANLICDLKENPYLGVELGNGVHKIRMAIASKGKGKSGGARVITYVIEELDNDVIVHLLAIYDKSDISAVSDGYIKSLVALVELD